MKKIFLTLAVLAVGASGIRAAEFSVDDFLTKISKHEQEVRSVEFNFDQEIVFTLTKEKQRISGKIIFKKPSLMKFSQELPDEQYIISNGKKVWAYNPSFKQVVIDSWSKWTANSMVPASLMNFGNGFDDLKKNYDITFVRQEGEDSVLLLNPRKDGSWKLKIWVSKDLNITKTMLTGENIVVNTSAFNYKINPEVSDSIFNFKAPPGVQTLEMP